MEDCATRKLRFETKASLALEAAFDGGTRTSDGSLIWLSEVDEELQLCETIAACVPKWRKRRGHHSLGALIRQRVFQIASGYEDQNGSNTLRADPLLKMVCGSLPESASELASQPTLSRLENAVDARGCDRMAQTLLELYTRGCRPARSPVSCGLRRTCRFLGRDRAARLRPRGVPTPARPSYPGRCQHRRCR
jgi:Transposase DDE domain group 1